MESCEGTAPPELGQEEDQGQGSTCEEGEDQGATCGEKVDKEIKTLLSLSQIAALLEEDQEGVHKLLEEFLNFTHIKARLKKTILIYGYGAGFFWAKGMNFSLVQISRFMDLLNFFLENIRDKHLSSEENFKELEKAIVAIGVTNPEQRDDLDFFSIEQAKAIIDYFVTSLFEHYKAYEFIFHYPKDNPMLSEEAEFTPPILPLSQTAKPVPELVWVVQSYIADGAVSRIKPKQLFSAEIHQLSALHFYDKWSF